MLCEWLVYVVVDRLCNVKLTLFPLITTTSTTTNYYYYYYYY